MSYCRWSSDDHKCDVYVYEHCDGGYVTHVASKRYTADTPCPTTPKEWGTMPTELFADALAAQRTWLDAATLVPIGLPHDGESFSDDTPGECAARLESLRALGYIVPQYAIDALKEEENTHEN
jgi:hypothetical protein